MGIEEIQPDQTWRLINIPNRPDVVVKNVNKYNGAVYWHYVEEKQINESEVNYFLKTFKRIS